MRTSDSALLLAALFCTATAIIILWQVPKWQLSRLKKQLDPKDEVDLEIKARTVLAQIFAGLLLVVGAYSTWKSFELAREGQVTERFTKAVEQLGSASRGVRMGGIYALARIARDSDRDRWVIMDILAAYVRDRAPWQCDRQHTLCQTKAAEFSGQPGEPVGEVDIQAAVNVLIEQDWSAAGDRKLVLQNAYLRGIDFSRAKIPNAILNKSYLGGTKFVGADLTDVHMVYTCIPEWAEFQDATVTRLSAPGALLKGAAVIERAAGKRK